MADYDTGYGKTPTHTRFPPGRSGNPKGRPKRAPNPLGEVVQEVMESPAKYRENGRTKTATRTEVRLKMLLARAIKGSVRAADTLFEEHKHALRYRGVGNIDLVVMDFLPDFDGQTADQKTASINRPMGIASPGRRASRKGQDRTSRAGAVMEPGGSNGSRSAL